MMKIVANLSRIITGIVFIFSGYVKVVDPLGTAYKFVDYFVAMHLDFLSPVALPFAIIMVIAELVIGLALLFNILPKLSSWALLLFMVAFTPLTLWLAVANPVHDCGCFGDALILSNWATFGKNVVLLALTIIVFIYRKKFKSAFSMPAQWALMGAYTLAALFICIYALQHLPPIDFRPYKIGANIREGMSIPESERDNVDVYESVFIYEKNGEKKEFTLENLPDESWTFVDAQHKLIKQGYVPPIHDFSITPVNLSTSSQATEEIPDVYDALYTFEKDGEINDFTIDALPGHDWYFVQIKSHLEMNPGNIELVYQDNDNETHIFNLYNLPDYDYHFIDAYYTGTTDQMSQSASFTDDITDIVLDNQGYTFLMISVLLDEANTKRHSDINKLAAYCQANGYDFMCLTASSAGDIEKFAAENKPIYNFYNTDPITLKTIVRSNPGLVLIKNGTVLNKWAWRDIPQPEELNRDLMAYSIEDLHRKKTRNMNLTIAFVAIWIMTVLFWVQSGFKRKKK